MPLCVCACVGGCVGVCGWVSSCAFSFFLSVHRRVHMQWKNVIYGFLMRCRFCFVLFLVDDGDDA